VELTLKEIEKAIEHLENKIDKQGMVKNERDLNHLDNLQQLYISKL
jgi:non-ribosomal peptide synthetase component E (peptide arylation enzyme)|tara:strand:+ start:305 stop:442 length:138 start_codon:yes stop_codon:yes gene_type:complete